MIATLNYMQKRIPVKLKNMNGKTTKLLEDSMAEYFHNFEECKDFLNMTQKET